MDSIPTGQTASGRPVKKYNGFTGVQNLHWKIFSDGKTTIIQNRSREIPTSYKPGGTRTKPVALPPIEGRKTGSSHLPICAIEE